MARLIALVAGALPLSGFKCNAGGSKELVLQSVTTETTGNPEGSEWRLEDLAQVLQEFAKHLSSECIAEALDSAEILITQDGGEKLYQVYAALLRRPFPVSVLTRVWCNREHAQLPLLLAGMQLLCRKSDLVSTQLEEPLARLIPTLLQLSRLGHAVSSLTAIKQAFV